MCRPDLNKCPNSLGRKLRGPLEPNPMPYHLRWPKYVRLQRMKKIMLMRLKMPPAINQFNSTIDKNQVA